MKKILFALAHILLVTFAAKAQENGTELAKQAGKSLAAYNMDPNSNKGKLTEAMQKIDQAMLTIEAQSLASAWITIGEVYTRGIDSDMATRSINPSAPFIGNNDALVAFQAYKSAYEKPGAQEYEKSEALKGIQSIQTSLISSGIAKFEAKDYENAYLSFEASLQAHEILTAAQLPSQLYDPNMLNDQRYYTAIAAALANRCADAIPYLETLVALDYVNAFEALYNCKVEIGDEAGAEKVLAEGRKKFPQDAGLLFAEIYSYLKKGKLDELTNRLKQAIQQEPNNVSLYVTLGNVYDNLYQTMLKDNNDEKATEYFNEAKNYYEQAAAIDPTNVDALYSTGALFYNKAAFRTQEMNALPEDFSSEGLKKLKVMRDEVLSLFDQSLPYFKKAEALNPNDLNTLIALQEIYAYKGDQVLSSEFKKRLDVVRQGGTNPSAYF